MARLRFRDCPHYGRVVLLGPGREETWSQDEKLQSLTNVTKTVELAHREFNKSMNVGRVVCPFAQTFREKRFYFNDNE